MARRMTEQGRTLLKRWEALRLSAYRDSNGTWTIGWGHTGTAKAGMVISRETAETLFSRDIAWAEAAVERLVKVPLADNQFDALVSWVFNIGETEAAKSTLVRMLNDGEYDAVPAQLRRWKFETIGGKSVESDGLKNRRTAEIALWASDALTSAPGQSPAPVPRPASPERSGPSRSATLQASGVGMLAAGGGVARAAFEADWKTVAILAAVAVVLAVIMRERLKAWKLGWT